MSKNDRGLVLNFFPAELSATRVPLFVGAWVSSEDAEALRLAHKGLHTWRDGSNIYAWFTPGAEYTEPPSRFSPVTVSFDENPRLFKRLLLDAVDRRCVELGFSRRHEWYVNFDRGNLVGEVPALATAAGDKIGLYPKVGVDAFFTRDSQDALRLGLVVDVLYTTRIGLTLAEWVAAGMSEHVIGTYVVLDEHAPEAAQFPDDVGKTIGKVAALRDKKCILEDRRPGAPGEIAQASVRPESARLNLNRYLMTRYEKEFEHGEGELTEVLRSFVRAKKRHRHARGFVHARLQADGVPLELLGGVTAKLAQMASCDDTPFRHSRLKGPSFSFDRAGAKFGNRVDIGLQDHGPYDGHLMTRQPHRLLVIAPREFQGTVANAVAKLLNGVNQRKQVFTGLKAMYRQPLLDAKVVYVAGSSMADYAEGFTRALAEAPPREGQPKFDLALPIIQQRHRLLPDSENPYFQLKALALITDGIPTQALTIEKLRESDYNLQYILNTAALAIYAKLGGTSHVLKLTEEHDGPTELIFGVGRSTIKETRFGEQRRTVGFATVFRSSGEYLFNTSTPYCDDESYERTFEETIKKTVRTVAAFEQLPPRARVRLVFHVPRRPGRHEVHAILNAVHKLPQFDVEFALLHVNDDHHFQVYDLDNQTPLTRDGEEKSEAGLLPQRGTAVELGPRDRLVTFIGPKEYKGNGTPRPLRLTLDEKSTFVGLDYLVQQVYQLSFMNAGSLTPGIMPVTVAYAESMADLTGRLRGVQNWTVELIHQRLGRKLWFV